MNQLDELLNGDFSWHHLAACKDIDTSYNGEPYTDIFYPPRDKNLYKKIADEGKKYCLGTDTAPACPVRAHCLWEAVSTDHQHGIWGGLSHRERNALVRKWRKQYKSSMTLKEYIFKVCEEGK